MAACVRLPRSAWAGLLLLLLPLPTKAHGSLMSSRLSRSALLSAAAAVGAKSRKKAARSTSGSAGDEAGESGEPSEEKEEVEEEREEAVEGKEESRGEEKWEKLFMSAAVLRK